MEEVHDPESENGQEETDFPAPPVSTAQFYGFCLYIGGVERV